MSVVMRGPSDLNLVTNALVLPANPSPSMNTLRTRQWSVCRGIFDGNLANDCRFIEIQGNFTSVTRVPEPGTLALLGLAAAGLAATERCRRPG